MASVTSAGHAADWKLVWSDDFDKPGLPDAAKWAYETGFIRNEEQQFYTKARPENARVENGLLVIEAQGDLPAHAHGSGRQVHVRQLDHTW